MGKGAQRRAHQQASWWARRCAPLPIYPTYVPLPQQRQEALNLWAKCIENLLCNDTLFPQPHIKENV